MKKRTLGAIGASIALAAGAVFVAVPATAADIYYPDVTLGAEGESYPAGWFIGDPAPGTAPTQDDAGLLVTGRAQLLFGGDIDVADGPAFEAAASDAAVVATGDTTFQIPVFFDGEGSSVFTTLRPVNTGTPDFDGMWISSYNVTIHGVLVLASNVPVPFSEILDAFDAAAENGLSPVILAFGVFVAEGSEATIESVTFNGDTHYFTAEPEEETPVGPAPAKPIIKDATYTG